MNDYLFKIQVRTEYLFDQSKPSEDQYVFAYHITITNEGKRAAQLIARHWVIQDAHNKIEEVRGLGVVGHQPFLEPSAHFEYTSAAVIATPQGSMRGEYLFVTEEGKTFEVPILEFVLTQPHTLH